MAEERCDAALVGKPRGTRSYQCRERGSVEFLPVRPTRLVDRTDAAATLPNPRQSPSPHRPWGMSSPISLYIAPVFDCLGPRSPAPAGRFLFPIGWRSCVCSALLAHECMWYMRVYMASQVCKRTPAAGVAVRECLLSSPRPPLLLLASNQPPCPAILRSRLPARERNRRPELPVDFPFPARGPPSCFRPLGHSPASALSQESTEALSALAASSLHSSSRPLDT